MFCEVLMHIHEGNSLIQNEAHRGFPKALPSKEVASPDRKVFKSSAKCKHSVITTVCIYRKFRAASLKLCLGLLYLLQRGVPGIAREKAKHYLC